MLDTSRLFGFGLLFSLLPLWAFAQLEKGDRLFQQDAELVYLSSEGQSELFATYQGEQGVFLSDRFLFGSAAGGGLLITDGDNNYSLLASPFARFYFNPENERFNFFLGAQGNLITSFGGNSNTDISIFPHVGANYFVQPDVSIRGRAGVTFFFDNLLANPFTIQFDLEPFFRDGSWDSRKSMGNTMGQGAFTLQDAQFILGFAGGGTQVALGSELGYMATDQLLLGSGVLLESVSDVSSRIALSPFVRYYLTQDRTSWYLQGQVTLDFNTIQFFGGNQTFTQTNYFVGGGFNKFLNQHVALDARLGLNILTSENLSSSLTGVAGQLGMQYHFGGGQ